MDPLQPQQNTSLDTGSDDAQIETLIKKIEGQGENFKGYTSKLIADFDVALSDQEHTLTNLKDTITDDIQNLDGEVEYLQSQVL